MDNEKLLILKMLEEGKISAAEASNLLDSLKGGDKAAKTTPPPERSYEKTGGESTSSNDHAKTSDAVQSFSRLTKELGKKLNTIAKDIEPTLTKVTEKIVEQTIIVTDKLSKTLSDTEVPSKPAPKPAASPSYPKGTNEKSFETNLSGTGNALVLSGYNGALSINGYNGDKLTIKVSYKAKVPTPRIELNAMGGKYALSYDESSFETFSVNAFIPTKGFRSISLQTNNAAIEAINLEAEKIDISNINGTTALEQLNAQALTIDSSNGPLRLKHIYAAKAKIENTNEKIHGEAIDVENLQITAFNSQIEIYLPSLTKFTQYDLDISSCNAPITLNVPQAQEYSYNIKARTTMGGVKVNLPNLFYTFNERAYVEGKTKTFQSERNIKLNVETSNNQVSVN